MGQNARQPWLALGISRATWYRLGKPTTKPEQPMAQALLARAQGVSLRSFQRTARIVRKAPSLADSIATGSQKPGRAERVLFPDGAWSPEKLHAAFIAIKSEGAASYPQEATIRTWSASRSRGRPMTRST